MKPENEKLFCELGVDGLCLDMEKKTTNFLSKGFLTASVFPNFLSLQP